MPSRAASPKQQSRFLPVITPSFLSDFVTRKTGSQIQPRPGVLCACNRRAVQGSPYDRAPLVLRGQRTETVPAKLALFMQPFKE
jgi:hypothetical protein